MPGKLVWRISDYRHLRQAISQADVDLPFGALLRSCIFDSWLTTYLDGKIILGCQILALSTQFSRRPRRHWITWNEPLRSVPHTKRPSRVAWPPFVHSLSSFLGTAKTWSRVFMCFSEVIRRWQAIPSFTTMEMTQSTPNVYVLLKAEQLQTIMRMARYIADATRSTVSPRDVLATCLNNVRARICGVSSSKLVDRSHHLVLDSHLL